MTIDLVRTRPAITSASSTAMEGQKSTDEHLVGR
ncbi:hypothetical protein BJ981_006349 [Sphaerisporangium krabiense]|uniref:Uncharacterized protein n=1 Tax=Sphaerisporangium krabiense TaxID=763782 RepID=A0A7W8ZAY3_9ACTN|nr:hypothetical protein [Sphaerisporangium krabiense]